MMDDCRKFIFSSKSVEDQLMHLLMLLQLHLNKGTKKGSLH